LLVLAAALALFHLGNAAMLPLYGLAVVANKQGDPASFVALTIVVAQGVMIIVSLIAMRMAEKEGLWLVLLVSFVALPIRGLIAAFVINRWGVYPVQILDGIGAGLQSVAVPALVARILNGTGRVNVGQGAVMTMQGLGASLSPALGGWIAQEIGYSAMFMILGSFAIGPSLCGSGLHRSSSRLVQKHRTKALQLPRPSEQRHDPWKQLSQDQEPSDRARNLILI
jgi:MFS family permease